jgi:tetratricopeptide (TPR) repeat protein
MRFVFAVIGFVVGIAVGAGVVDVVQEKEMDKMAEQKAMAERARIDLQRQLEEKTTDVERLDAMLNASELEFRGMDQMAKWRDGEIAALKQKIAELEKRTRKAAGTPDGEETAAVDKTIEEGTEKTEEEKERARKLLDLLLRIESSPGDRALVSELSEMAWEMKDEKLLREISDRLGKVLADALAKDPESGDILFNMGSACAVEMSWLQVKMKENPMVYGPKMGDVAYEAIGCFTKAIEKNPGDNEALLARGFWNYHMPGNSEQAEADFAELVKRAREQTFEQDLGANAFAGMAMVMQKAGRNEEAKKYIEEGLALYPQSEGLARMRENMQK